MNGEWRKGGRRKAEQAAAQRAVRRRAFTRTIECRDHRSSGGHTGLTICDSRFQIALRLSSVLRSGSFLPRPCSGGGRCPPSTVPGSRSKRCTRHAITGPGAAFRGPGNGSPGDGWGLGRGVTGRVCRRVSELDVRGMGRTEGRVIAAVAARGVGAGVSRTKSPRVDGKEDRMITPKVIWRIFRREREGTRRRGDRRETGRARPGADFGVQIGDRRGESADSRKGEGKGGTNRRVACLLSTFWGERTEVRGKSGEWAQNPGRPVPRLRAGPGPDSGRAVRQGGQRHRNPFMESYT